MGYLRLNQSEEMENLMRLNKEEAHQDGPSVSVSHTLESLEKLPT